ncbi:MAG TPA: hypothetical protein VK196_16650, partial [Magnetospirillum sp.]|nr:hypothetical protein [Magnetospirillum sp.]
ASVTSDGAGRPWVLLHRLGSKPPELFTWRDGVVMRDLLSESGTSVAGLAVDRKGTVWLTVPTHNALGEWRGGRLTLHPLPTARALPIAVVAAEDGGVWVTEWDGRKLARYDGAGKWREYPVPEGEDAPIALAFARDGGVWFSTLLAYDVFRLDPASGAVTRHAVPPPALAAANSAYGACAVPTGEGAKDVVSLPASRHPRLYPSPPAVQLESYCNTGCHTWQRVEQAGQRRTDWTATVDRMIDVNGAPLSPEQRTILIQYLNATYVRGQK